MNTSLEEARQLAGAIGAAVGGGAMRDSITIVPCLPHGESSRVTAQRSKPARASSAPARGPAPARDEGRADRAARHQREREQARIEKDIEAREARRVVLEQQLADPEVYHDGTRAKELVGEYERLRAELESLWQRIGEL